MLQYNVVITNRYIYNNKVIIILFVQASIYCQSSFSSNFFCRTTLHNIKLIIIRQNKLELNLINITENIHLSYYVSQKHLYSKNISKRTTNCCPIFKYKMHTIHNHTTIRNCLNRHHYLFIRVICKMCLI